MKNSDEWALGQWGERLVRQWLTSRSWWVIPISLINNGGAPAFETWIRQFTVLPDIFAGCNGRAQWIEVKTKTKSVPNALRKRDEHGLEERLWRHYIAGQQLTGIPGAIAFVQTQPRLLYIGALDTIEVASVVYDGSNLAEPRRFFDLRRFEKYNFGKSGLTLEVAPTIEPKAQPRPWEIKYRGQIESQQPPLF